MSSLVKIILAVSIALHCSAAPIMEEPPTLGPMYDNSSNDTDMSFSGDNITNITDKFIIDCSEPILEATNIYDIQSGLTVLRKYIQMKEPHVRKVST